MFTPERHLYFGKSGEETAVSFLKSRGYKILKRNYKTKLGEIDIIAKDGDTWVFVEVKTRHTDKAGLPFEALSTLKQRQISKAALAYLKENNLLDQKARFDAVSIIQAAQDKPRIDLLKNAFELDKDFLY